MEKNDDILVKLVTGKEGGGGVEEHAIFFSTHICIRYVEPSLLQFRIALYMHI